ncbi:MAG: hypothetical protein Roseis2KO_05220 [Roseivirga sp.]
MIIRVFSGLVLALCAVACSAPVETVAVKTDSYFDLVGLLDTQTALLLEQGAVLEKQLTANGETEVVSVKPESEEQLKAELRLFYEANINKLGLDDAYFTEELPGINGASKIINTAKKAGPDIRMIEYDFYLGKISQIRVLVEDKNDIYTFEKEMTMKFEPLSDGREILTGYSINGKQKMVMKSDLNFSLEGSFLR